MPTAFVRQTDNKAADHPPQETRPMNPISFAQSMARRGRLALASLATVLVAALALSTPAAAQDGTIRLIVGFPAGATADALTRVMAEALSQRLGQPVIVDNRTGAGGRVAAEALKNAAPDGTTLMLAPVAQISIFPTSFAGQMRYDPFTDFAPVAHVSNFQIGLGIARNVPAENLAQYIAWVKSDPEKNGFYGSAAPGSLPHFFGVMFGRAAGLQMTHVPYRGTAPAMQALAGGEIAALSTVTADLRALVQADRARLVAVAGAQRDPMFPEVPTFRELGFDLEATPWYAMFAPAGVPPAVLQRIERAALDAVGNPTVRERIMKMGLEPTGYDSRRLAQIMREDFERWAPPIRASGFKPQQ
jgi:tripartite-type tricarboxylate transporter receptor subunit TctC